MRKQLGGGLRRQLAVVLATALVFTGMPNAGTANAQERPMGAPASITLPEPEPETTWAELFSEDGSLAQIPVDEDVYWDVNDEDYSGDLSSSVNDGEIQQIADFAYKDLIKGGDDSDQYCILIAGDGYTAAEQDKFLAVAQKIADYFLTRSPFNETDIKKKINIRAVCTVSNVSGVQEAEGQQNNPWDTYFKATFWNNTIERLVCIHDQNALNAIVNQYMPNCKCPIVVCNTTKYGGSGGGVCTISANESAPDIALHEFGHTGGGLADEYWESTYEEWNRFEGPNRTLESNAASCKWADLIGKNGIGLYPFSENNVYDCFRPHQQCEMRYLNQEFCDVCKRHLRKVLTTNVDKNVVINNASELQSYCEKVNMGSSTLGKTVTLNADITLSGSNNLYCMSTFDGTFDGNGHTIKNVNMSSSDGTYGFIGTLGNNGTVKNLHLENASISGGGYYTGFVGNCKGTMYGCSIQGSVSGANGVGGISGHTESSANIHDNYNLASVYASSQVCGGVIGWAGGGNVKNNYSYGTVSGGSSWSNGIDGYSSDTTYSNNYYLSGSAGGSGNGSAKSASEFSNGTVLNLLNSVNNVWKQGGSYPVSNVGSTGVQTTTTTTTAAQAPTYDAFNKIEAENYSSHTGVVIDTNASASNGYNIGGVTNGTNITFDKINFTEAASSINFYYSGPTGISGYVEVICDGSKVGQIALSVNGSSWATYGSLSDRLDSQIPAGVHKIKLNFVTTNGANYVCNLDYFKFIKANGDTTAKPGYTYAQQDTWVTSGNWGCYFGTWNGTASGCYQGTGNPFKIYFFSNNKGADWISQAKYEQAVTNGHIYKVEASVSSDKACQIGIKEDISNEGIAQVYTNIAAGGTSTLSGTYTVTADTIRVIFELGRGVDAGTTLTFNSIKITDVTPVTTTQAPTTTAKPTTTAAQTTTAKATTTVAQTTKADTGVQPEEVFGHTFLDVDGLTVKYTWGADQFIYDNGQTFNVYADGNRIQTGVGAGVYDYTFATEGTHTIKITGVLNGKETAGQTLSVNLSAATTAATWTPALNSDSLQYKITDKPGKVSVKPQLEGDTIYMAYSIAAAFSSVTLDGKAITPSDGAYVRLDLSAVNDGKEHTLVVKDFYGTESVTIMFRTVAVQTTAAETTTVQVTTTKPVETTTQQQTIAGGIEVNGYQINAKTGGVRTIYSVDSKIANKAVSESGLIYSLDGYSNDSEMVIGSKNSYVHSYASTSKGLFAGTVSNSDIASTYLMTMKFADKTVKELTIKWKIRAYAKLSDGTYVYTDVKNYTIYNLAEQVYKTSGMSSQTYHSYVYENILKKVTPTYTEVKYSPVVVAVK